MKNVLLRTAYLLPGFLLAFTLACSFGCSSENIKKAGGTVKLDGKLLSTGTVEFYPVGGGRTANAVIQEDGSFTISYRKPGDGLPPGKYKVAVISVKKAPTRAKAEVVEDEVDGEGFMPAGTVGNDISIVPTLYNSIERTPLTIEVLDDGKPQQLEIEVTSK